MIKSLQIVHVSPFYVPTLCLAFDDSYWFLEAIIGLSGDSLTLRDTFADFMRC